MDLLYPIGKETKKSFPEQESTIWLLVWVLNKVLSFLFPLKLYLSNLPTPSFTVRYHKTCLISVLQHHKLTITKSQNIYTY